MLAFAALMGWRGNLYHRPRPRLGVAAACLLFGLLIELAQWPHNPKDASVWDLAADAMGLALGALLLRTPLAGVLAGVERWLGLQQTQGRWVDPSPVHGGRIGWGIALGREIWPAPGMAADERGQARHKFERVNQRGDV